MATDSDHPTEPVSAPARPRRWEPRPSIVLQVVIPASRREEVAMGDQLTGSDRFRTERAPGIGSLRDCAPFQELLRRKG